MARTGDFRWVLPDHWTRVEDLHPGRWLAEKEPILIDHVSPPPAMGKVGSYLIYWRFESEPNRHWYYRAESGCSFMLVNDDDEVPI